MINQDIISDSDETKITNPSGISEESFFEATLRPQKLEDYVGQEKIKENLKILIDAARQRKDTLEHILLYGPPGLGKTTLAVIVSSEMSTPIRITSGPAIQHAGDLASILSSLVEGEVLFIDEIHQLIGAGRTDGAMDAANLLKPALARGDLFCIGATTNEEYQKYIQNDPALERRFRQVPIEEPSAEVS